MDDEEACSIADDDGSLLIGNEPSEGEEAEVNLCIDIKVGGGGQSMERPTRGSHSKEGSTVEGSAGVMATDCGEGSECCEEPPPGGF